MAGIASDKATWSNRIYHYSSGRDDTVMTNVSDDNRSLANPSALSNPYHVEVSTCAESPMVVHMLSLPAWYTHATADHCPGGNMCLTKHTICSNRRVSCEARGAVREYGSETNMDFPIAFVKCSEIEGASQ